MSTLTENNKAIIENAVKAIQARTFYAQYPEHPKAYGEEAPAIGQQQFQSMLNTEYGGLLQEGEVSWAGEEVSPYTLEPLNIRYPLFTPYHLVDTARKALATWKNVPVEERSDVLVEALERIKDKFFLIAYATMHTTGQPFMMSFQASGPHSNDRALEALALGFQELTRFPSNVTWEKPMGKFSMVLEKQFKPVPKGIALVIGCSTFPVWNSVPGIFASLVTGNPVIVKPHPKSVLPIAIVVEEIQKTLNDRGYDANTIQLAVDSSSHLITKQLAENPEVKIIDYTGSSSFGAYVESLPGKAVFTEKAGVNSVILDSSKDLKDTLGNLAFSVSLYSGQMCTAPQNFFVPATGVKSGEETIPYEEVIAQFRQAVLDLTTNPKMGPGTLGAVQSDATFERVVGSSKLGKVILEPSKAENPEFAGARTTTPTIIEVEAKDMHVYEQELFGPIVLVIKTQHTAESIQLARNLAEKHGAITCAAYTTDEQMAAEIETTMEEVFTPVTLNLSGPIWVNQHAAFSDFHVTGGNPAGNASFTNPDYINRRFVWVGHRRVK
ncbi:MAG: phenylacetic acid degradation protein PaaN [Chitinophagales bacterium]|nr:phenylacetic acid degradation protein PaaN [Chitinophagales bacterium]